MSRAASMGPALLIVCLALTAPLTLSAQSRESNPAGGADLDEDGQPSRLPALPKGMTITMIQQGDSLFRGKGGCVTCHSPDASGMPASGSNLTSGLNFVPVEWGPIDSLIRTGIPEPTTRSPVAMPGRGAQSNLTDDESQLVAAYIWATATVKGEPWQGGHRTHGQ